ncbi:DNA-directed RNA polymerase specialized sigma24 family protein [Micromonospora sp. Llam0]|uniref:sigma-70 family RNA polymerase sigma factor n=1 Tax=Micromonospora sp. Llam0 TaxID=2485143 RepID=UPI000F47C660|nr:sigma-70 family RNA polymerase sigma factor [Micromonospora sp. Llam0]ROO63014.1 DNA-directed RNA polymerase specialized sigma24 family protein [Micromonospora sp. Llam0]
MGSTHQHATTPTTAPQSAAANRTGQPGPLTGPHTRDSSPFAAAYRTHLPALTAHVAARLTGSDLDAVADLVHDAFADALADPTLIDADVLASLRRLCDRACARYLWSQRRYLAAAHTIYADQRADPPAAEPDPVQALAALPAGERQVAYLRFLDGHSTQATARLLGRSVPSVIHLERRARRLMREHLADPAAPGTTPAPAPATFTARS